MAPISPRARAWVRSWRGPPVTRRGRGRPCRSVRLWIWVRKPYDRVRDPSRPFRARSRARGPCCPAARRTIWISLPVGHPSRPDALIAPTGVAEIDRVPLPVRGRSPPGDARLRHPAQRGTKRRHNVSFHVYTGTLVYKISNAEPLDVGHRGPSARKWGQRITPGEANDWRAGCPISLKFCRGPPESAEAKRPHDLIDPHPIAFNIRFGIYAGNAACCPSRGSAVLDSADGRALALVAGRVREGEHGLSPLCRWVRPGCRATLDGLSVSGRPRRENGNPVYHRCVVGSPPTREPRKQFSGAVEAASTPRAISLPTAKACPTLPPDWRPAPRYHASPRRGGEPDRQACRS